MLLGNAQIAQLSDTSSEELLAIGPDLTLGRGWDQLERSIRFAEDLTRSTDDGLEEVIERYPAVRRFAPTFLAAFTFRTARSGDPLLGAIEVLRTMYRDSRSVLPKLVLASFGKPRERFRPLRLQQTGRDA